MTALRLPTPEPVDATAPVPPIAHAAIAPQPTRPAPLRTAIAPSPMPMTAIASDGIGVRSRIGGSVMYHAITPRATPAHAVRRGVTRLAAVTRPPLRSWPRP